MKILNISRPSLPRDEYGALDPALLLIPANLEKLKALRDAAVKAGQLPTPFIVGDKNNFNCLNLDIYDIFLFRNKVAGLVVQSRRYSRNRKGHSRTSKEYFLVIKSGSDIVVTGVDRATCAKRANNTVALGDLVKHYQGKLVVKCKTPAKVTWTGYMVLAKNAAGELVSTNDGSQYCIGKWRREAARAWHGGGFYYYLDQQMAIDATSRSNTVSECNSNDKCLVLCEVEAAGKSIRYSDGTWESSRLRVIRELQTVTVLQSIKV